MDCYGAFREGKARCLDCKVLDWCKDAGDPPPFTGPNPGPTGDDAAYEVAVATVPQPDDPHRERRRRAEDPAAMIGELFGALAMAAGRQPDRITAIVLRLAGQSYSQIGAMSVRDGGKSKQAVHKDINRMAELFPALGDVLRLRFAQTADLRMEKERILSEFRRRDRPGHRMAAYREVAEVFGMTPNAVECCLRRIRQNG